MSYGAPLSVSYQLNDDDNDLLVANAKGFFYCGFMGITQDIKPLTRQPTRTRGLPPPVPNESLEIRWGPHSFL